MPIPDWTASDFLQAWAALLPRGAAWPRDPDSEQMQTWAALTPTYVRSAAAGKALLVDAFPATTVELLPEWELTTGLPDPCAGPAPTLEQARAQVVARLVGRGGQSIAYFTAYAATLGYPITITEFSPFRFGLSTFGQPMNGPTWANAWQINAPTFSIEYFSFGQSEFGEPFAYWSNNVLQCEMNRVKPAHTVLSFAYVLPQTPLLDISFVLDLSVLSAFVAGQRLDVDFVLDASELA